MALPWPLPLANFGIPPQQEKSRPGAGRDSHGYFAPKPGKNRIEPKNYRKYTFLTCVAETDVTLTDRHCPHVKS